MSIRPLKRLEALAPYAPGLSIPEIQARYGLAEVIKLASNENPLGAPPLAQEAIKRAAGLAFRYPRGGNPRLKAALAKLHNAPEASLAIGNGSDEVIDLIIRVMAQPGVHNIVCCDPCFNIYPIQAAISGAQARRAPLKPDFSPDFASLLKLADEQTRVAIITTPDNPSGHCPPKEAVSQFAHDLAVKAPDALLLIDEAYMDFAPEEGKLSLLGQAPANVGFLRTFSKSYGLAGMRVGYAILPESVADVYWRARLPFSVSVLAEEAALAALEDTAFREATLKAVANGREELTSGLCALGCHVWPSVANFIMFRPPAGHDAKACFEDLLRQGVIIRHLASYGMPENLRVTVGDARENKVFLKAMAKFLGQE